MVEYALHWTDSERLQKVQHNMYQRQQPIPVYNISKVNNWNKSPLIVPRVMQDADSILATA